MSKFCSNCGNEVHENAIICVKCGCAIPKANTTQNSQPSFGSESIITVISQRMQVDGIIWCVIGAVQILMSFLSPFTLIVGILNIISGYNDITYSQKFPAKPVGIIEKVKPLTMAIITLVYNLIIGGIIGVIGSIYYFVAVRGYVLEHEKEFAEIESQYIEV